MLVVDKIEDGFRVDLEIAAEKEDVIDLYFIDIEDHFWHAVEVDAQFIGHRCLWDMLEDRRKSDDIPRLDQYLDRFEPFVLNHIQNNK